MPDTSKDEVYLELLLAPIRLCADYTPKFGTGASVDLDQFTAAYGADPFYSWVGLDSPLIYAAHKAAGGITSIYRQVGIGSERLFRAIVRDTLGLSAGQATWDYEIPNASGGIRKLQLDGRIDLEHVREGDRDRIAEWLEAFKAKLDVQTEVRGAVFEVRQGYKSMDSKRQNADLANAANAYTQRYLPVLAVMSLQLDAALRVRYHAAKWGVLSGTITGADPLSSTYDFMASVLGYDLRAFFERTSPRIRTEMASVAKSLLEAK